MIDTFFKSGAFLYYENLRFINGVYRSEILMGVVLDNIKMPLKQFAKRHYKDEVFY